MASLEKMMFFIPNRLFVEGHHLYVSFNIAVIPDDMQVTTMILHVPLPAGTKGGKLSVHEIRQGWDERLMGDGYRPKTTAAVKRVRLKGKEGEARVDLSKLAEKWRRDHLDNHGVYLRLHASGPAAFTREQPPYVIIASL